MEKNSQCQNLITKIVERCKIDTLTNIYMTSNFPGSEQKLQ